MLWHFTGMPFALYGMNKKVNHAGIYSIVDQYRKNFPEG